MCERFHEDFGDEPSIEERNPDVTDDERRELDELHDGSDDEYGDDDPEPGISGLIEDDDEDGEIHRDRILERQELEDFEGYSPFDDYDAGGDW